MAANVESMFSVRAVPWHGLGTCVEEAPDSGKALELSGLNWRVRQESLITSSFEEVNGYLANVREDTGEILGIVSNRYQVVQNEEAFAFTDALLDFGVVYETAGSLMNGKRVWMLARLPETYLLAGEETESYLVFSNSHDGNGAIRVAVTPIRVVCQNTLNLALQQAKRSWSSIHVGAVQGKLEEARATLLLADGYMKALEAESQRLSQKKLTDKKVLEMIDELIPLPESKTPQQRKNLLQLKSDLTHRYFEAPDLKVLPKNGWRFLNAVSDFATHAQPLRKTSRYQENLFMKTIDGHPLLDQAKRMVA